MTARPSRLSSVSLAKAGDDVPPERVLTLASVLEEEFDALHPPPENAPPTSSVQPAFVADDIADLSGFAQVLLDGLARGKVE